MSLIEGAETIQGGVRIGQLVIDGKCNYERNKLEYLKLKAARCIFNLLSEIKENLYIAEQVPRPKGKQRNLRYWKLPYLFGDDIVSSKVLPIGFQFAGKEPDPKR